MNTNSQFVQDILAGNKIAAIKAVREFIGQVDGQHCSGLKECKDFVEAMTPLIKGASASAALTATVDAQVACYGRDATVSRLEAQVNRIKSGW